LSIGQLWLVFTSIGMVTVGLWLLKPQYRGGFRLLWPGWTPR
jgi:hypothetical protein